MTYKGKVVAKAINIGSKSEKIAPFLVLDNGTELEMRKANKTEFVDKDLLSLDGKKVECEGIVVNNLRGGELIIDNCNVIQELHSLYSVPLEGS